MGCGPFITCDMEQKLIEQIEAQAAKRGMAASTLCRVAVNDGKLYARLKSGNTITLATIHKLNSFFKSPVKKATSK